MPKTLITDEMPLIVECAYSNIGEQWWAEARHEETGKVVANGTGQTRPEALRELADLLELEGYARE